MKKLLFFLFIACIATTGFSQDMAIAVYGLDNTDKPTRMLIQKATPDGENAYLIVKSKDSHSPKLKDATTARRVFTEIRIVLKLANGVITTNKLTQASLYAYSETGQGATATETFRLEFEDEIPLH